MDTPARNYARYPSLQDRTVLITGGADGIGSAMVQEFAKQGSRVAFLDINHEKSAETIDRCRQDEVPHVPLAYEVDLRDITALQEAVGLALQDLGGVEVLVNNAASDDRHTWQKITPKY